MRAIGKLKVVFLALVVFWGIGQADESYAAIAYKHLSSTAGINVLLLQGPIESADDPQQLAHELDTFPTKFIAFFSPGGDRSAAMKFGRMIRGLGLTTLQIKSSSCLASCLLAYAGGVERYAEPGSVVIQQSAFIEASDAGQGVLSAAATAESIVKPYLAEMGIAPELFDFSQAQAGDASRVLNQDEALQLKITTGEGTLSASQSGGQVQQAMAPSEAIETALGFFGQFNAAWSQPKQTAMNFLKNSYADSLTYYGKQRSAADVLSEKDAFADRWPIRIYAVRNGTARASCSNTCSIFGIIDWYASSRVRQKSSSGAVNFSLVWNPTTGKILSETGRIVETDKNPTIPNRIIRRWIADATSCRLSGEAGPPDAASCQSQNILGKELNAAGYCYQPSMGWQYCGGN